MIDNAIAGKQLTIKGKEIFIGLFFYNQSEYKEALVPKLFIKDGSDWRHVGDAETLWELGDSRDFTPKQSAEFTMFKINEMLELELGAGEYPDYTPWFQQIIEVYNNSLSVENGKVVVLGS